MCWYLNINVKIQHCQQKYIYFQHYSCQTTKKIGYIRVRQYMKQINIWQMEKLVFQVCLGAHWFTILVKPDCQNIDLIDSLNRASNSKLLEKLLKVVTPLINLLVEDNSFKKEKKFMKGNWCFNFATCPLQDNSYDCGVHVCLHLLVNALNMNLDYNSKIWN
jgi:Ulp1 family protease